MNSICTFTTYWTDRNSPPYDIIATIKIDPKDKYVGSESNGITSLSYNCAYRGYTFEDYRTESLDEIDDEEIFAMNIELSKNQVVENRPSSSKSKKKKKVKFKRSF